MIEWLKLNKRPVVAITMLTTMYVLARFFPGLGPERELLIAVAEILNLVGIAAVPSFARVTPFDPDETPGMGTPKQ